jgi:hypothetical protein
MPQVLLASFVETAAFVPATLPEVVGPQPPVTVKLSKRRTYVCLCGLAIVIGTVVTLGVVFGQKGSSNVTPVNICTRDSYELNSQKYSNALSQCYFNGNISEVPMDVNTRYHPLLQTFMPTVVPTFESPFFFVIHRTKLSFGSQLIMGTPQLVPLDNDTFWRRFSISGMAYGDCKCLDG